MKKNQIPVVVKAHLLFLACVVIFGFSDRASTRSEAILTESQFHDNVASIVNFKGLSQEELALTMSEAELRKSGSQTASDYVEDYMNTHFKAAPPSTNRVSIAAPGIPDQNQSVACNLQALRTVTQSTVGYYYAYAIRCDGTYKYDAENFTGGSTVYVRAEASTYILEAFILF